MIRKPISALELAQRFDGVAEIDGRIANPQILAMLQLDQAWPDDDSVPWCSAFVNYVAWLLDVPRSKSLRARSWLHVGRSVDLLVEAEPGFDVVVLKRGGGVQPGVSVVDAPGHVGFYAWRSADYVGVFGGNQSNRVSVESFPVTRVLRVQRIFEG